MEAVDAQVILTIDEGNFETGFSVALEISGRELPVTQLRGRLPPALTLATLYQQWQNLYRQWGGITRLDPIENQPTNVSCAESCKAVAKQLHQELNEWLAARSFLEIREKILEQLTPRMSIQVLLRTEHLALQRLPWHAWDLFDRYPYAELGLGGIRFSGPRESPSPGETHPVRILAVLGTSSGIDTTTDVQVLKDLPNIQLQILETPSVQALTDSLWDATWDILFFAGHSTSAGGEAGQVALGNNRWLSIAEVHNGIQNAARNGLRLAILNSCDGLAVARDIAALLVPFIIAMREPVPDQVAHSFLKYFLQAYSQGHSLYLAVRKARERLQSLEDEFPCASWLPVLFQNPALVPPSWQALQGQRGQEQALQGTVSRGTMPPLFPAPAPAPRATLASRGALWLRVWQRVQAVLIAGVLILILRGVGGLQPLELWAYDQLLGHRPLETKDSRIVLVEIDEATLQASQSHPETRGSIADAQLYDLLQRVNGGQPRVIGLDLYRDYPSDQTLPALTQWMATNRRLIGICKRAEADLDPLGVASPPGLGQSQVGFSDFLEDADGVVRRQLMALPSVPMGHCGASYGLALQLALAYLADPSSPTSGPRVQFTAPKLGASSEVLMIGDRPLPRLPRRFGGYQRFDNRGFQLMLNYRSLRSPFDIADRVTVAQVLAGQVSPTVFADRIVLIGVTANTTADHWETPNSRRDTLKSPGMVLQAHMVSQILGAVLNQRPLIHTLGGWAEGLWVIAWGFLAAFTTRWGDRRSVADHHTFRGFSLQVGILLAALGGLCYGALAQGLWLPLIPAAIAILWVAFQTQLTPQLFRRSRRLNAQSE